MVETSNNESRRELKAILFADVVGYTRLMQDDEEATHKAIRELTDLFARGCDEFDGEILDIRGDGFFAIFSSAVNSVRFANKTQESAAQYSKEFPGHRKIRFRIGIHLGDVLHDTRHHFGDAVNIAARIEGLCDPGGVFISSAVHEQVKNSKYFNYENLGLRRLKNIEEPIGIFRIVKDAPTALMVASPRQSAMVEPADMYTDRLSVRPSIAVLPFKNSTGNPDYEYFSEGITEDIITNLAKFHNLFVISRNSSFTYKDKTKSAKQIGSELGVRYIADGSIRTAGNRVRISIQLVDTHKDQTVWTEHYDRNLDDIFEVQDDISAIICNVCAVKISSEESANHVRMPGNHEAYDMVLKGQQHIYRYTREDLRQARKYYEIAAKLDPRYARALSSIAQTLNFEWLFSWSEYPDDTLEHALDLARQAVTLDDGDARGHARVGFISLYQKNHEASINAYLRALQLNPNDADVIADLADTYAHSGHSDEAVALIKKAMHLNPFYPDEYLWNLGGAYYNLKQYQDAINAVEQMNNPTEGSRILAASYAQLGQLDLAQRYARRTLSAHPDFSLEQWSLMMPDKYPDETTHFIEGLRKAGLN
ncbi:MAG: tetratricopeptide repeat protein [Gammaproteobacteria bacterium]|nr:MAG: adenylate/guanylate cyclase domain-containing protein [Gammaproteobacteria bacterium]UCH38718.1 MAG: tetratricopeptide repeat protein [Gammaproteobacteria bacterium]